MVFESPKLMNLFTKKVSKTSIFFIDLSWIFASRWESFGRFWVRLGMSKRRKRCFIREFEQKFYDNFYLTFILSGFGQILGEFGVSLGVFRGILGRCVLPSCFCCSYCCCCFCLGCFCQKNQKVEAIEKGVGFENFLHLSLTQHKEMLLQHPKLKSGRFVKGVLARPLAPLES